MFQRNFHFDSKPVKGKLVAFEGISGCGKSSQIEILKNELNKRGYDTIVTEWNSDPVISPIIGECKKNKLFTPLTWSILHATDFVRRYTEVILPSLIEGKIVIADRYYATAYTRDTVRGLELSYARNLYSFAYKPDITFFLDITPEKALKRRLKRYDILGYYSSGADLGLSHEIEESWLHYNTLIRDKYYKLKDSLGLEIIDAENSIEEISESIIAKVINII